MILTEAQRAEAEQVLTACGIEGEQMRTSLDAVCRLAGDTTLPILLDELRAIDGPLATVNAELMRRFGNESITAATVLMRRMP